MSKEWRQNKYIFIYSTSQGIYFPYYINQEISGSWAPSIERLKQRTKEIQEMKLQPGDPWNQRPGMKIMQQLGLERKTDNSGVMCPWVWYIFSCVLMLQECVDCNKYIENWAKKKIPKVYMNIRNICNIHIIYVIYIIYIQIYRSTCMAKL